MSTVLGRCAVAMRVALVAMVPAVGVAHAAQEAPGAPPGQAESGAVRPAARGARMGRPALPANPDVMTVQQVEQYFDQVVLYQAQSQLQLSDDQFLRFGPALRRLQTTRRQQQRQRVATLRDLNALLVATPLDEAAVTAKIKELDEVAAQAVHQLQEAQAGVDALLDVRQRGRFRVFEEMMERRKLDLLARARRAGAGPPPTP